MLDPSVYNRIVTSLNHEEPDQVPIWDFLDNRGIVEHIAPDEPDYNLAMRQVCHALGIDLTRGWGASYHTDMNGTTSEEGDWKITGQSHWTVKYPIQNIKDLETYEPWVAPDSWITDEWLAGEYRMRDLLEPRTLFVPGGGCGFHSTYGLMGQQLFSYAIYDAPAHLERVMEVVTDNCVRMARAAADAKFGPIYFIGDDIAYKNKLLFSPEFLRRTFIKCLARCCEPVKNAGMKVIFHSDGFVMDILDDMIDAGIDGLNPIEPLAGMDIGYLKKRYGKNLVLVGNVDCSQLLPFGSVEDVVQATRRCIREASPGGGHFIGSSSEITPATPVESILAFYDACRTYGQYPIQA